ncbi:MAG TPA: Ig-like domain-containing protein, partial [Bacteroidia bacterium]|nr:Ig-like domain-containing protein [Bacteroidia bacterium]
FITVCEYEALDGCRQERLTITVKSENEADSPTANTDIAVINGDEANPGTVIINVLSNDKVGNEGGVLGVPVVQSPPSNGTVTVNLDGTISYTPNDGFYGIDVFTYEVCETPGGLCATAIVEVTVLPGDVVNTTSAADDFVDTDAGVEVSGNVAMNDIDPEDDFQTVGAYTSTVDAGTLVMEADGDYTFTPALGFSGSVDFVYTICDDQVPVQCADATLHILVKGSDVPDLTPTIVLSNAAFSDGETKALAVNIIEILGKPTNDQTVFTLQAPPGFIISAFDPNMTDVTPSGSTNRVVTNIQWHQVSLTATKLVVKANTGTIIAGTTRAVLGFNVTRDFATTGSTGNISVTITDDGVLGYDSNGDNNLILRIITNQ